MLDYKGCRRRNTKGFSSKYFFVKPPITQKTSQSARCPCVLIAFLVRLMVKKTFLWSKIINRLSTIVYSQRSWWKISGCKYYVVKILYLASNNNDDVKRINGLGIRSNETTTAHGIFGWILFRWDKSIQDGLYILL